jgi:lipoyl-dependent peroxiredoxin
MWTSPIITDANRCSRASEAPQQPEAAWTKSHRFSPPRQPAWVDAMEHTESSDHVVSADLSVPKAMGGPGKPGTATPEHLFAAGYAACFGGALDFVGKQHKQDAAKAKITCAVSIRPREGRGFGIAVRLRVEDNSLKQADLTALAQEAHEKICP